MSALPTPIPLEEMIGSYYAPPELDDPEELREIAAKLREDTLVEGLLRAAPGYVVVLSRMRQIVHANERFLNALGMVDLEALIGLRVGNALQCVHALEMPGGCGTSEACTTCGAGTAIHESKLHSLTVNRECRVTVDRDGGGALEFEAIATPVSFEGHDLTLLSLRDISGELRRRVLERVFFHDVLNTAGGLQGLSRILVDENGTPGEEEEWIRRSMLELSNQLVNDIQSQRALAAAEAGELQVESVEFDLRDLIQSSIAAVAGLDVSEGKTIRFEDGPQLTVVSDPNLLQRVVVNLLKNAVEATPGGGTVTLDVNSARDGNLVLEVHNPTVMPREVQLQIFQRSFSTKEGYGRGIGTYSVKLLGEKYLGGKIDFTSGEPHGTLFRFTLPTDRRAQH